MAAVIDRRALAETISESIFEGIEHMFFQAPIVKNLSKSVFDEIKATWKNDFESYLLSSKFSDMDVIWINDWLNSELNQKIQALLVQIFDTFKDGSGLNTDDDTFQTLSANYFSKIWNVSLDEIHDWKVKCPVELANKITLLVKQLLPSKYHNNSIEYGFNKNFTPEEIDKALEITESKIYKKYRRASSSSRNKGCKKFEEEFKLSTLKLCAFLWKKFNGEPITKSQLNSAINENVADLEALPSPSEDEMPLIRKWLEELK